MLLKKIKRFIKENKAQGALEYIMLIGGIIAVAVIVAAIYTRSAKQAATGAEKGANVTYIKTSCITGKELNLSQTEFKNTYGFDCQTECEKYGVTGAGTTWCIG